MSTPELDLVEGEQVEITGDQLASITKLLSEMENLQDLIENEESNLALLKRRLWLLQTQSIPTMMREHGIESMKFKGKELELKIEYSGSITQKNADEAHAWLNENGYGALIKEFKTLKVHPQTLKAWVKEMFNNGNGAGIPDIFNPYAGYKAELK